MTASFTPAPARAVGDHPSLHRTRELLQPELWRWVRTMGGHLTAQCGYQLDLCDADGVETGRLGGKLIRPALTLLCCGAAGGTADDVLPAAAAIELLHNASLIHDDIMDGDRERRHRPTVWARFGVPSAILVGDGLIALGFEAMASSRHPATVEAISGLARTLRRMGRGQDADLSLVHEAAVSIEECLAMLSGKTGVLVGSACRMGASFSPAPASWADRFDGFGTHLGIAFQLVDDMLDLWGDPLITGKPVGSDLRARKKTAPIVAALTAGNGASARLGQLYAGCDPLDDDAVQTLADLVEEAGGRDWAQAETSRQVSAAWTLLEGLDLEPAARADLADLSDALLTRDA